MRQFLITSLFSLTAAVAAADVVGEWAFDEGQGDVTKNGAADKHHGKITGATWTEHDGGKALVFAGPDYDGPYRPPGTFVELEGSSDANPTAKVEVKASVYPTFNPVAWGGIVEKGVGYGSSFRLLMLRDGKVRATIGNEHLTVDSSAPLELDTWTSLRMVYDGSILSLYVNGDKVGDEKAAPESLASEQPIEFGRRFTGKIDDVTITY